MSEKIRTVGDLEPAHAEQFAFLCTFLPNYYARTAGSDFNDFVDNSDPNRSYKGG